MMLRVILYYTSYFRTCQAYKRTHINIHNQVMGLTNLIFMCIMELTGPEGEPIPSGAFFMPLYSLYSRG